MRGPLSNTFFTQQRVCMYVCFFSFLNRVDTVIWLISTHYPYHKEHAKEKKTSLNFYFPPRPLYFKFNWIGFYILLIDKILTSVGKIKLTYLPDESVSYRGQALLVSESVFWCKQSNQLAWSLGGWCVEIGNWKLMRTQTLHTSPYSILHTLFKFELIPSCFVP